MLQWFLCDASGSVCLSVIEHVFTRGLTGKFVKSEAVYVRSQMSIYLNLLRC